MKQRLALGTLVLTSILLTHPLVEATGSPRSIVGTWELVVDNGSAPPFNSLVSFLPGGVVIVGPDSAPPPGQSVGQGQGVWRRIGKRRYAMTFKRNHYDAATGALILTFVVRERGEIDHANGSYQGEASGTLLFNGGGSVEVGPITTSGTRMKLE